jgi:hypothetical protein
MKLFLFAAASLILITPEALARDLIRVGTPADHSRLFPQSAVWPAPHLLGGPTRDATKTSSQTRIITVDSGHQTSRSGIRVFRGGSVTPVGTTRSAQSPPTHAGMTITRVKKRPQNPYKTVIVYAPQSVREIPTQRNAD